jgi:hypothetical protein
MRTLHNVRWSVSLSNGETIHEGKGEYEEIDGELSPWQKLQAHLETLNAGAPADPVRITSLWLTTQSGATLNLPSAGRNPRFRALGEAHAPTAFRMFRNAAADIVDGLTVNGEIYTVAEATFADNKRLQIWVDEATGNAWCLTL